MQLKLTCCFVILITMFECFYCKFSGDFSDCVNHATSIHSDKVLKLRTKQLDTTTGHHGFKTLNFNIVPGIVDQTNKIIRPVFINGQHTISIVEKESPDLRIAAITLEEPPSKHPSTKRIKTSTSNNQHPDTLVIEVDDEVNTDEENGSLTLEIQRCLPTVIKELKEIGQLDNWLSFHQLVAENKFPLDNIAFHLFMDVCKFYSLSSSSSMRYSPTVKKFWRIGYCLFHGKFIRFMSGPKNIGNVLENPNEFVKPENAKVNFVVPSKVLCDTETSTQIVKPGILNELVNRLGEQCTEKKTYKLCVDGKKINSGRSVNDGDIDLFGFEQCPTLKERRDRLQNELSIVDATSDTLTDLDIRHKLLPEKFPDVDKLKLVNLLKQTLLHISCRIRDLRTTKLNKSLVLERIKKESGPDWRKSKFVFVISSLETDLHDVSGTIGDLLKATDDLSYGIATINSVQHLFSKDTTIFLNQQSNYIHLSNDETKESRHTETRYIKQHSEAWHDIRQTAKVTGSTLNNAIGLGTLKQQQQHFDKVIFNKSPEPASPEALNRMKYGSDNELNAIATLVCKILPVFEPGLKYFEEGCYKFFLGDTPVVVSPDGSVRTDAHEGACFGVECKCPYPNKTFTTPVFYNLPRYYVTQVLSEMAALRTTKLYFICYSAESSSVFLVKFSEELWESITNEIIVKYPVETSRPAKKTAASKSIKKEIDKFLITHVTFVAEVPSVKGIPCTERTDNLFCHHHTASTKTCEKSYSIRTLQETVRKCRTTIQRAYELHRTRATELLAFMVSDLDRQYDPELHHAIPVAYGLKGYSLPTKTVRSMIEHVIQECSKKGLYIPVCSFDGQWYKMAVRDRDEKPLTLLQLQKDVYNTVKSMSKGDILKEMYDINVVKCTLGDLPESVDVLRSNTCLYVGNGSVANRITMTKKVATILMESEQVNEHNETDISDAANHIVHALSDKIEDELQEGIVSDAIKIATRNVPIRNDDHTEERDDGESLAESLQELFHIPDSEHLLETMETDSIVATEVVDSTCAQTTCEDKAFLKSLNSEKSINNSLLSLRNKFPNVCTDVTALKEKLKGCDIIDKSFTKTQIISIMSPLMDILRANGYKCSMSKPKYVFTNLLSSIFGDGSTVQRKRPITRKKQPQSLVMLCRKTVRKLPKTVLNCVYAQHIFPSALQKWRNESPYGYEMNVSGIHDITPSGWYSRPEFNSALGNYLFVVLDAYHQICGLRRLFCGPGIIQSGVSNIPIREVAQNSQTNQCGISVAIVKDLIDKQSIAYAVQTFSEKVEQCLLEMNAINEAHFCSLVRHWYLSEDEPGIPALKRAEYRLRFRQWLLDDVRFDTFPPYGSYVKGIPVVLYEGLLLGIERKLQLYPFTKMGTYNTRAIGSLDIENFFSSFQDIDPRGTGVLRPDDIPTAVGVAMELLDARLDSDRGFYMQTAVKRVYPTNELHSSHDRVEDWGQFDNSFKDLSVIHLRDHPFDSPQRTRGKRSRKSGKVSQNFEPSRNPIPVREHHRARESKILPHVRRGLQLGDFN